MEKESLLWLLYFFELLKPGNFVGKVRRLTIFPIMVAFTDDGAVMSFSVACVVAAASCLHDVIVLPSHMALFKMTHMSLQSLHSTIFVVL